MSVLHCTAWPESDGTDKLSELVPLDLSNGPFPDIEEKVIDRNRPFTMNLSRGINRDRWNRAQNNAEKFRTHRWAQGDHCFQGQDEMDDIKLCKPKSSGWLVRKPGPRSPSLSPYTPPEKSCHVVTWRSGVAFRASQAWGAEFSFQG